MNKNNIYIIFILLSIYINDKYVLRCLLYKIKKIMKEKNIVNKKSNDLKSLFFNNTYLVLI